MDFLGESLEIQTILDYLTIEITHFDRTDSKLKGNFPKTKENAYTRNTQISEYTQDFTVGPQVFNAQSDCTMHI